MECSDNKRIKNATNRRIDKIQHFFLLGILFALGSMLIGCKGQDAAKTNITEFLTELYQVESTEEYEQYLRDIQNDSDQGNVSQNMVKSMDLKLIEVFGEKLEPYCTEEEIELLMETGYLTKFDQIAWQEKCQLSIRNLKLNKDSVEQQYQYELEVIFHYEDGRELEKNSSGMIRVNEENKVEWMKIQKNME